MTSRDFCYWLQGFFELQGLPYPENATLLDVSQVRSIRDHLALVFKHEIDPSAGGPAHQAELNKIHAGNPTTATAMGSGEMTGPVGGVTFRC